MRKKIKSISRLPEKGKSIRSAVCHAEMDERINWIGMELIIEIIGI
jgi:hypothetical protein